ncbi:MAG: cyclic nucleotide-binding domain-containing protein [Alphaproteobacteria bacterium]|nr:cyclic nucleotide-binding domain-containing protein [Alphaproteobacteria bacterium]
MALVTVIVVNIAATAMATVPEIGEAWHRFYRWTEFVAVLIFTVEYLARAWVSVEDPRSVNDSPWTWRLRHALTPLAIIDLVAILPSYIELVFGGAWEFTLILRVLRLFKLLRFTGAFDTIFAVIRAERRPLIATFCVITVVLLLISTLAYVAEREAQPDKFGSIPAAFYWGIVTLATVGYGDIAPITPLGRATGALGAVLGILTFAMPAGIIASGFMEELRRRDFIVTWQLVAKVPLFRHLTASRIASVALVLRPVRIEAGSTVVRKGEEADGMYFIVTGELLVEAPGHTVMLKSGDFFGEMALLDGGKRSTTVRAGTGCELLHLGAAEFRQLAAGAPDLDAEVRRVADERRRDNESSTADRQPA